MWITTGTLAFFLWLAVCVFPEIKKWQAHRQWEKDEDARLDRENRWRNI